MHGFLELLRERLKPPAQPPSPRAATMPESRTHAGINRVA
jgi:hypothetical protein